MLTEPLPIYEPRHDKTCLRGPDQSEIFFLFCSSPLTNIYADGDVICFHLFIIVVIVILSPSEK